MGLFVIHFLQHLLPSPSSCSSTTSTVSTTFYTMLVSKYASSRGPEFWDLPPFPVLRYVGAYASIWMHCDLRTFVWAIVHWPSVIVTAHWEILTLGGGSSAGFIVMPVACLCRLASVLKWIVPSFSATKRSIFRGIFHRLCRVSMGCRYQKLVRSLWSYVVHLFTSISPTASIIGRVTATLSFACFVMHGE